MSRLGPVLAPLSYWHDSRAPGDDDTWAAAAAMAQAQDRIDTRRS